jgi:transcriptional regulator with XRE-family HTH domain
MPPRTAGAWLRELRESRNLSQQKVEEKSHGAISRVYLSLLERDEKKNPTVGLMLALARVYDVRPTEIFTAYQADMLREPLPPVPNGQHDRPSTPTTRGIARSRG